MSRQPQDVSIVIPTHNRADSLARILEALSRQDVVGFEVVVVADGCTDATRGIVARFADRLSLTLLEQVNQGPSAARNTGAAGARGDLLLFLDDDVEPVPGLVGAHLARHAAGNPDLVVIGYYPTWPSTQTGCFRSALMSWWETLFDAMAYPGRQFQHVDLVGGNVSLPKALFTRCGGFAAELRCHEDYELGYRLIQAGARFAFDRRALALHHETSDMARSLGRKYAEGVADVRLAGMHPELLGALPLAFMPGRRIDRIRRRLALRAPGLARLESNLLNVRLSVADVMKARNTWRRLAYSQLDLHYWMGVREAVGDFRSFQNLYAARWKTAPATTVLEIDLSLGLDAAERALDQARPVTAILRHGGERVGQLGGDARRERLHGGHLRPALGGYLAHPLMMALAANRLASPDALTGASASQAA